MKHILFDLKDCPSELLDNEEHIRMSLYVAAKVSNSELLNINAHKFKPQGVTDLAMIADTIVDDTKTVSCTHLTLPTTPYV